MTRWSPLILPRVPRQRRHKGVRVSPPTLLAGGFVILIIAGTLLLKCGWATHQPISWLEAAFTATSAVTVTGLAVVDTGSQFTLLGQLVILLLIQLGGIGLMTFAVLTAIMFGFKIGLREHLLAKEALNQTSLGEVIHMARAIAAFAFSVELIGMLVLVCWWAPEMGWSKGLYHALFYSISAFNNAGFALSADSLSAYADHLGVSLTISALYIVGGLGYVVIRELIDKRCWRTLSVYVKFILTTTLLLNLCATVAFLCFEYDNPLTLGKYDAWDSQLIAAWFQGTVPRTAGFNSLDVSAFTMSTCVMMLFLMFVGGAPNSTASGIKISTLIVLLAATRSFLKGRMDVTLHNRSISTETVIKALAVTMIGMILVFGAILCLSFTEKTPFLDLAFEVVSAFGTVGLSRGITGDLSVVGQLIIMAVMLIGRVGPLTLGYMLTASHQSRVKFARAEFPIG